MTGIRQKTFLNTGSYEIPTFFVVPIISDESVGTSFDEAPIDRRSGPAGESEPTVRRGEITIKVMKDPTDARWQQLATAFWGRSSVDVLALGCGAVVLANGLLDVANSADTTGDRFLGKVFSFSEGRSLNDGVFNVTSIKPAWNSCITVATIQAGEIAFAAPGVSPPPSPPGPAVTFADQGFGASVGTLTPTVLFDGGVGDECTLEILEQPVGGTMVGMEENPDWYPIFDGQPAGNYKCNVIYIAGPFAGNSTDFWIWFNGGFLEFSNEPQTWLGSSEFSEITAPAAPNFVSSSVAGQVVMASTITGTGGTFAQFWSGAPGTNQWAEGATSGTTATPSVVTVGVDSSNGSDIIARAAVAGGRTGPLSSIAEAVRSIPGVASGDVIEIDERVDLDFSGDPAGASEIEVRMYAAASGGSPLLTVITDSDDTWIAVFTGMTNGVTYYAEWQGTNSAGTGATKTPRVPATPQAT